MNKKREFRDCRMYQNSDKKPKRNDIVKNMGEKYTVKSVSKCGAKLFIKGHSSSYWLNTGCSFLIEDDLSIKTKEASMPEWLQKRIDFETKNPDVVKKNNW